MTIRTLVFIVCSPNPRVGKTTTARLLSDYFTARHSPAAGFDTDAYDATFAGFCGAQCTVCDIASVAGQVALFDRILVADGVPKVVDLWHRSFKTFLGVVKDIGFAQEALRLGVEVVLVYHADAGEASLIAARALAQDWPQARMIIVENAGAAPLGDDRLDLLARYPSESRFTVPALDVVLARSIDAPGFSLARFLLAPPASMSLVVRAGLRAWVLRVFAQFQAFELRLAFEAATYLR